MLTKELKRYIETEIGWALDTLSEVYGIRRPHIYIRWDLKGRSRLGEANHRMIRINPDYAAALGEAYRHIAIHEACHVAVDNLKISLNVMSRKGEWAPHGRRWKDAMRTLGVDRNRLATDEEMAMATEVPYARNIRRHSYTCPCGIDFQLSQTIVNQINRGRTRHCGKCKGSLFPI